MKDFSKITKPLILLTKKGENFVWTEECEVTFSELKLRLTTAPVLAILDQSGGLLYTVMHQARGLVLCLYSMIEWWPMPRDNSSHMRSIIRLMTWNLLL